MRDPMERAWSHAKHDYKYRQGIFASFAGSFAEIPDQKFIEHFTDLRSINTGDYLLCLNRWLSCFHRDQVYFGFSESIKTAPRELLRQVFDHLGVRSNVDLSTFPIFEQILPGIEQEVPARLKPYLQAIYGETTRELRAFLKEQLQVTPPPTWAPAQAPRWFIRSCWKRVTTGMICSCTGADSMRCPQNSIPVAS